MSLIQVGVVDKTGKLDPTIVQSAAVALNIQVAQDLPKYWPVAATVQYLSSPSHIPVGVWPVFLVATLPPGEGGFHMDKHNQPYAEVIASPDSEEWTIDASHEILEMLVDPYGNRMQSSTSIEIQGNNVVDGASQFSYLVEACDPCEADNYGYQIHGIAVSDFITPHFYDPVQTPGTYYSFTGAITRPRELLPGGYISYIDLATEEWQQILWVDPSKPPQLNDLGPAQAGTTSLRAWVDGLTEKHHIARADRLKRYAALHKEVKAKRAMLDALAKKKAKRYA